MVNRYKCPHFGLKGHITKMHGVKTKTTGRKDTADASADLNDTKMSEEQHEQVISQEASKVFDQILNDILCVDDEEDMIKADVTLEEESNAKDTDESKEYCEGCDMCDYQISANKKYLALKSLKKHKENCHNKLRVRNKCDKCDFLPIGYLDLK